MSQQSSSQYQLLPLIKKKIESGSVTEERVEESIQHFLNFGFDINEQDERGVSALMYTASNHSLKVMAFLKSQGAKVDQVDFEGNTAMHWALMGDVVRLGTLKNLSCMGVPVDAPNNKGNTPLAIAVARVFNAAETPYEIEQSKKAILFLLLEGASLHQKVESGQTLIEVFQHHQETTGDDFNWLTPKWHDYLQVCIAEQDLRANTASVVHQARRVRI